jgi:hypothetical protein
VRDNALQAVSHGDLAAANCHAAAASQAWLAGVVEAGTAAAARRPKGGVYAHYKKGVKNPVRVGRAKNLRSRELQHAKDPKLKGLQFKVLHYTDSYNIRRGLEHLEWLKTGKPGLNKIRPISPQNPNMGKYVQAARRYLKSK